MGGVLRGGEGGMREEMEICIYTRKEKGKRKGNFV